MEPTSIREQTTISEPFTISEPLICEPLVPAKFYNRVRVITEWDWIAIHCTESPREDLDRAAKVAAWFARPWNWRTKCWNKSSAHCVIDANDVIWCVPIDRIAYHARGGLNPRALGIELVGKASQTREQWLDSYGCAMLERAAGVIFALAKRFDIPLIYVLAEGINAEKRGITTHREITHAKRVKGGHLDPGVNFPMDILSANLSALSLQSNRPR